jgi:type II secretory pathway predicted ATPase ExeA
MYLDFYQLNTVPFPITPEPEFLFLSPSHQAALGAIMYGIAERYGFIALVGEGGVGKTTILRAYLETVDPQQYKVIHIAQANIGFRALLRIFLHAFGVDVDTDDLGEMVHCLQQRLLTEYAQGRIVALIVDEAQNLPVETLEHLRMLSTLETATHKLLQIVLIGQPALTHKLDYQRLAFCTMLAPLTDEQSLAYIGHRLAKVAMAREPLFTQGALELIIAKAQGTPRLLNILCTKALIAGWKYREKPISATTVSSVIHQLEGAKRTPGRRHAPPWAPVLLLCAGVVGLALSGTGMLSSGALAGYVHQAIGTLKDLRHTAVTSVSTPQQRATPQQYSVSERVFSDRAVTETLQEHRATTPSSVSHTQQSTGHIEPSNGDSQVLRERIGSHTQPVETPSDDLPQTSQAMSGQDPGEGHVRLVPLEAREHQRVEPPPTTRTPRVTPTPPATPSGSARKSCDELKAEIQAKLDAKKITGYSLTIMASGDRTGQQIVGSCEGNTKKIAYTRSQYEQ